MADADFVITLSERFVRESECVASACDALVARINSGALTAEQLARALCTPGVSIEWDQLGTTAIRITNADEVLRHIESV